MGAGSREVDAAMSGRRELQQRLRRLGETREILNAMKNLALMETRKLARYRTTQQQVVELIETSAGDFLTAYPPPPAKDRQTVHVDLLLGSERGFCGDFNEALLAAVARDPEPAGQLIVVGHKLCRRLAGDERVIATLDGAGVADEVPVALNRLIDTISSLQTGSPAAGAVLRLTLWHHAGGNDEINRKPLLPPFRQLPQTVPSPAYPPLLNLPPPVFLAELIDQYLFALLHQAFYLSLLAESQRRVTHMDGAVTHLDSTVEQLTRKSHSLRQEEITEEIEVILLSAAGLEQPV
jgi:F-type H+-transporting ATPase subunit gamma